MKLNNKGFAISTILYMILIMAVVLIILTLAIFSSRKLVLDKIRKETTNDIYNKYNISYRQVLETLKEEAITLATNNSIISTTSIKIQDLNSSISKEILDGYSLYDKYITVIPNNDSYDVYLGKKTTITNLNNSINPFVDILDFKIYGNSKQNTYTGKNLWYPFDSFEVTGNGSSHSLFWKPAEDISFKDNMQYTISFNVEYEGTIEYSESGNLVFFSISYTDDSHDYAGVRNDNYNQKKISFTTNPNKTVKRIGSLVAHERFLSGKIKISNIQVEKGSTATDYEPYVGGIPAPNPNYPQEIESVGELVADSTDENYGKYIISIIVSNEIDTSTINIYLDEPLRKIGDYADYIDIVNKNVIRNIKERVFSGSEEWAKYPASGTNSYYISISDTLLGNQTSICNRFNNINSAWQISALDGTYSDHSSFTYKYFRTPDNNSITTLEQFKEWVSTHNIVLDYTLNSVVEEIVDIPSIELNGEYSGISIGTDIKPSTVEFTIIEKISKL